MNITKFAILTFVAPFIIISCKTTKHVETVTTVVPKVDCNDQRPIYELDIKPVFEMQCNNCHGKRAAGGYDFTVMDDLNRAARNGELLGSIKWERHYPQMPQQRDKLDDITIKKIECWIEQGMKQ